MKKNKAQELLRKYCLGQCTKEELEFIERWYHSFDGAENEDVMFSDTEDLNSVREEMFRNITSKISQAEESLGTIQRWRKSILSIRAHGRGKLRRVVAIVMVAGIIVLHEQRNNSREHMNTVAKSTAAKDILPSTVYLSDGSVVWLKSGSKLEYPEMFTGNTRRITLVGEGFFDVAKETRPFIIHSTHFTTSVLGTSFNIKAYQDAESQEVVVVTGRVIVSVNDSSGNKLKKLTLKQNERAIYSRKNNSLLEDGVGEAAISSYTAKSKLDFDKVSLENIIRVLNATYGVNISLANESMKKCIITADLTDVTLHTSIEILCKTIDAQFTVDRNDLMLMGDGC